MNLELTDEEAAALARLLRGTIDGDRYPLSPRVKTWQPIPEKIEPLPVRAPLQPNVYAPPRANARRPTVMA